MSKLDGPYLNFNIHASVSDFNYPAQTYLHSHPDSRFTHIATGAIVFDNPNSLEPRVLLVQRCSQDSWPDCWEVPGGACDDEDASILYGAARELWEEAGIKASSIGPVVGDVHRFVSRSGREIGKFIFLVEAEESKDGAALEVKLAPEEHQQFVWASEEEVKAKKVGDVELKFTTQEVQTTILEAFSQRLEGARNNKSKYAHEH